MNRRIFLSTLLAPFVARWRKWFPPVARTLPSDSTIRIMEMYISKAPRFQFGFTGFKSSMDGTKITGQFLMEMRPLVKPRHVVILHEGPSPCWHGLPPVVPFTPVPLPWEQKSNVGLGEVRAS